MIIPGSLACLLTMLSLPLFMEHELVSTLPKNWHAYEISLVQEFEYQSGFWDSWGSVINSGESWLKFNIKNSKTE